MPTYEYKCDACGNHFEKFQNITEKPLTTCPRCGGKIRRLIGAGGALIFKGPGFYATDYARNSTKGPNHPKEKPNTKPETPSDTPPPKD